MIEAGVVAVFTGPLVVEYLVRTTQTLHLTSNARELLSCLEQFKQAAGDDCLRETLARHAGWRMIKTSFGLLVALTFATLLVGAVPVVLDWPDALWSPYVVAVSITSIAWWFLRKRFSF